MNAEGRAQSFNGSVKPLGETRPAWKVLRVLGNLLQLAGFDYESSEAIRNEVIGTNNVADANFSAKLNNLIKDLKLTAPTAPTAPTGAPQPMEPPFIGRTLPPAGSPSATLPTMLFSTGKKPMSARPSFMASMTCSLKI